MNFGWYADKPEAPEATWEDFSYFYRPKYYKVTVSERDHVEKTQLYYNEAYIPENENINNRDFNPVNFKSAFYIITHQGNVVLLFTFFLIPSVIIAEVVLFFKT